MHYFYVFIYLFIYLINYIYYSIICILYNDANINNNNINYYFNCILMYYYKCTIIINV